MKVLRRVFGPKREKAAEEWGRMHNKELHKLYHSSNIITAIKSRETRWTDM
jgi:hypothetical protein